MVGARLLSRSLRLLARQRRRLLLGQSPRESAGQPAATTRWTRGPLHAVLRNPILGTNRKLKPVSTKNIPDGTSNTLLAGEYQTITNPTPYARRTLWCYAYTSYNQSSGINRPWTHHTDYMACVPLDGGQHNCKRSWGSLHAGSVIQFVRCDGALTSISPNIDMELFVNMTTIQGEELAAALP